MTNASSINGLLRAHRDSTARAMRDALVNQLPGYAGLPSDGQRLLLDEVHQSLSLALDHSAAGEPNTAADLQFFRELGDRRGHSSFPFTDLVAAYHISAITAHRAFWQVATQHNYHGLLDIQTWSAREVPRAMQAAVAGYIAARDHHGQRHLGHELLIAQLLRGQPVASLAAAAGITLAPSYTVLVCSIPPGAEVNVARREAIRTSLQAIPGALYQPHPHRLLILLPVHNDPRLAGQIAADLVTSLAKLVGQTIHAAQAHSPTLEGIPDAATEAEEILTLLAAIPDAASRPYIIEELLVELAIAARPDIIKRLADQLAALSIPSNRGGFDHVMEVLRTWAM